LPGLVVGDTGQVFVPGPAYFQARERKPSPSCRDTILVTTLGSVTVIALITALLA